MWLLQTPIEALTLPTDSAGRTTLTGTVAAWHHLIRDTPFSVEALSAVASMPVRWSIWPWQQTGRRIHLHESIAMHEPLAAMIRADSSRVCVLARFPVPGKREADKIIEIIVVVPPEQYSRYELLVQLAMTLPSGHVALTIPAPVVTVVGETEVNPLLIAPGQSAVSEGMGLVVARGKVQKFSKTNVRSDRRSSSAGESQADAASDDVEDWLLFRADIPASAEVRTESALAE